jgi:hypothetical protein
VGNKFGILAFRVYVPIPHIYAYYTTNTRINKHFLPYVIMKVRLKPL